ncbi:hypothetical protein [Streptomyces sp. NPDC056056]|uniref:hypothetical protein n=1 Tax=Streptomyces sp. NPDC056056 TaxID=3345698 RepID=UPI0035E2221C
MGQAWSAGRRRDIPPAPRSIMGTTPPAATAARTLNTGAAPAPPVAVDPSEAAAPPGAAAPSGLHGDRPPHRPASAPTGLRTDLPQR